VIICWTKPSTTTQQRYLNQAKDLQFSYSEVGKSANPLPEEITRKYSVDRYRCLLGHGEQIFECAKRGLAQWCHFDLGWVQIDSPEPKMGLTVAVAIKTCWVWRSQLSRRKKMGFFLRHPSVAWRARRRKISAAP
jgi:uncharacterized protein (UPF0548 family)